MVQKSIYISLGVALIVLSFLGILFLEQHKEKEDALRQLEIVKEQQAAKAKEAAEIRGAQEAQVKRAQEERKAEEARKQAELEKQMALQLQAKLAVEEQRRKEEEQRAKEERALKEAARAAQEKREAEERQRRQEQDRMASQREAERRARTSVIPFTLYVDESRKARVALVHLGDQITVRVKRTGGADGKLYLGLGPLEQYFMRWNEPGRMRGLPGQVNIPRAGPVSFPNQPVFVKSPISDTGRMTVTLESNTDSQFAKCLQTREGVILYLGTDLGSGLSSLFSSVARGKGAYEVEASIYSNNQWGIPARSLR